MQAGTTGFANSYNPLALQTQNVSWTDLNGDGMPQGELGLRLPDGRAANSTSRSCRRASASRTSARSRRDIKRMYNVETSGQRPARNHAAASR